ncbi:MAG: alpha/beta hydrolase [Planctomycetota bacterium]
MPAMSSIEPLWPDAGIDDHASLAWYPYEDHEDDPARPAILIFPGGGYEVVSPSESFRIAGRLGSHGFHAAVCTYRVAPVGGKHPDMIQDAQRAVRMVRAKGPTKVGVMGFSAGGHLAASLAVHHDKFTAHQDDLASQHDARPDAVGLAYPVMDMHGPASHVRSRANLLGHAHSEDLRKQMSPQLHVHAQSPPAFLWHTAADAGVQSQNALLYAMACADVGVPYELHVYEEGRHGLDLAVDHPQAKRWPELAADFFKRHLV